MPITSPALTIAIALVGGLLALVGTLIVLNLRAIKSCIRSFTSRLDRHEDDIKSVDRDVKKIAEDALKCKIDCDRNTVCKEDWVRSEGYTRKEIKELGGTLARIEGKLDVAERMPEIIANTVRAVVKELK